MADIKETFVETMEEVNAVLVETAEGVKDFAVETVEELKEALIETEVSLVKSVETSIKEVDATLKKAESTLAQMKMEEMVEEVKPRLRRETFENSLMLSRVGGRQFLLGLLVIAQVMMQMEMMMLMLMLTMGLMLSVKTIVILLMLGLLFFLGGANPPPASPTPVTVLDPGMDWLRFIIISFLIYFFIYLVFHRVILDPCQVAAGLAGGLHHPPPHLAACKLCGKTLQGRQEVSFWTRSSWGC